MPFFKVLLNISATRFSFPLILSNHVSSGRILGFFHQANRFCSCVMQYIADICIETLLLVQESLVSCGNYRVKTLSSWGRSFVEVVSYCHGKKQSLETHQGFDWLYLKIFQHHSVGTYDYVVVMNSKGNQLCLIFWKAHFHILIEFLC